MSDEPAILTESPPLTVEPLDELKDQYDQSLNKGIVTPSKSVDKPGLKLTM
jgi:hypothetical protein